MKRLSHNVRQHRRYAEKQSAAWFTPDLFQALARVFAEITRTEAARRSPEQADAHRLAWVTGLAGALSCMVAGFLGVGGRWGRVP